MKIKWNKATERLPLYIMSFIWKNLLSIVSLNSSCKMMLWREIRLLSIMSHSTQIVWGMEANSMSGNNELWRMISSFFCSNSFWPIYHGLCELIHSRIRTSHWIPFPSPSPYIRQQIFTESSSDPSRRYWERWVGRILFEPLDCFLCSPTAKSPMRKNKREGQIKNLLWLPIYSSPLGQLI